MGKCQFSVHHVELYLACFPITDTIIYVSVFSVSQQI
uniref:Uncharacterized protein n=1 Tax=Anguilla anguilla TaxID=7936 RepID=A0A0E9VEB4_ANGAN